MKRLFSLLALTVALACPNLGQAQTTGPVSKGTTPAKLAAPAKLTGDNLVQTMRAIGFEITDSKRFDSGYFLAKGTLTKGDWTVVIELELCPDGYHVWIRSPLTNLPAGASTDALAKLLELNRKYGPYFFQIDTATRKVEMAGLLTAPRITPENLRADVDRLYNAIRESYPTWGEGLTVR